jgi:hypothetical protein
MLTLLPTYKTRALADKFANSGTRCSIDRKRPGSGAQVLASSPSLYPGWHDRPSEDGHSPSALG